MGNICELCGKKSGSHLYHDSCWREIAYWTVRCFNCVNFREQTFTEQAGYIIGSSYGVWGSSQPQYRTECYCQKLGMKIQSENAPRCVHFVHKETAISGISRQEIEQRKNAIIKQLHASESPPSENSSIGIAVIAIIAMILGALLAAWLGGLL